MGPNLFYALYCVNYDKNYRLLCLCQDLMCLVSKSLVARLGLKSDKSSIKKNNRKKSGVYVRVRCFDFFTIQYLFVLVSKELMMAREKKKKKNTRIEEEKWIQLVVLYELTFDPICIMYSIDF